MPGSPPPSACRIDADLDACARRLLAGEVLCAPTDSFYGLLAVASDPQAVARVLAAKGERCGDKAMPLLVENVQAAWQIASLPPWAVVLASLWPAPLTLGLPARIPFPRGVLTADSSVGVRVPAHDWLRALAARVQAPLTATSANVSGEAATMRLEDLRLASWEGIYAVEAPVKPDTHGRALASSVVAADADGVPHLVRAGPVSQEAIDAAWADGQVVTSVDKVWGGRASFEQPDRQLGYRFNLDSFLLVEFTRPQPGACVMDLGAGVGIIGQLLVLGRKAHSLVSIERQRALAALAMRNAHANGIGARTQVHCVDLRTVPAGKADLVVFNPPYFALHAGRPSACQGRDEARRECHGTLVDFVQTAARALGSTGRVCAIVPYERRDELRRACADWGFVATMSQAVLAFADKPPRHFLFEAQKGVFGAERRLAPWVIHQADGSYRADVEALTRGQGGRYGCATEQEGQ